MTNVLPFKPQRRHAVPVDGAAYMAMMSAPPPPVIPCPSKMIFERFVRSTNVEREAALRIAMILDGQRDECIRRWNRHRDEVIRAARKTMSHDQAAAFWEAYRAAVQDRVAEVLAEKRSPEDWRRFARLARVWRDPVRPDVQPPAASGLDHGAA